MDKAIEKIVQLVDSPLGLIAVVLIFFVAKRLYNLEEWVRTTLNDTLKNNTEALTKMIDHCKGKNGNA